MVGVNQLGIVEEHEYIFDIYTKSYDFATSNVQIVSAQDLFAFYKSRNKGADRMKIDIYSLAEYFLQHHPNGHYVFDECPFLRSGRLENS